MVAKTTVIVRHYNNAKNHKQKFDGPISDNTDGTKIFVLALCDDVTSNQSTHWIIYDFTKPHAGGQLYVVCMEIPIHQHYF